jgi:2-C-methyl-D-erythritol 4-phosphate cytidylyltransferase
MIAAIITAAGRGTRLQSNISKQFIQINGKPVLAHTLKSFQDAFRINNIYLVVPEDYIDYCREKIVKKYNFTKVKKIITGGPIRQDSVFNALNVIPKRCKIVAVHDGVRPLITADEINMLVENLVLLNKQDESQRGAYSRSGI